MGKRYCTAVLLAAGLSMLGGCAESHDVTLETSEPQPEPKEAELIGGVPANSPALNAVGTFGVMYSYPSCYPGQPPSTSRSVICTATLIGERVALTAKHCVQSLRYGGPNVAPYFAIGPNAYAPQQVVEVADIALAPGDTGGWTGRGRDVAVLYLSAPITGVRPLRVAALTPEAAGTRFGTVGYGAQNNGYASGTRRAGSVTVNALEGRTYELIFGTFEAFRDWYLTSGGRLPPGPFPPGVLPPFVDGGVFPRDAGRGPAYDSGIAYDSGTATDAGVGVPTDAGVRDGGGIVTDGGYDGGLPPYIEQYLRSVYDNTLLLPGYEAYVGNQPGDAQPCQGDSGSPLIRASGGELYTYGVVSGGIYSRELVCDYGAIYGAFGPEVVSFIENALDWEDPCGGVSVKGQCNGDVAARCTSFSEGTRRLTNTDCSLFAQTCAVASDGTATCVTPGEEPEVIDPNGCYPYDDYPYDDYVSDDDYPRDAVSVSLPRSGSGTW